MSVPPIKYVTDTTPRPDGYCPDCWATRRVIPLRKTGECWVCAEMRPKREPEPEIELPPAPDQASLEFDLP